MKYLICSLFIGSMLTGCTARKADSAGEKIISKQSLPDSIDQAIGNFDRRLDVKMRRKTYKPAPDKLVTLQKWFEYGDTSRLVKLRQEVIAGDTRMDVIQYHYINRVLAEIHDYSYDKRCDGLRKQCIREAKYFFRNGTFDSAIRREAIGSTDSIPVIERVTFETFQPDSATVEKQQATLTLINRKYASLPYQSLAKPQ